MDLIIYTDGAARGNPGPAGAGIIIKAGNIVYKYKKYLGETTNNKAEYQALIFAFNKVKELLNKKIHKNNKKPLEIDRIICYCDSELVVRQIKREYKVKNSDLAVLFVRLWNLMRDLPKVEFIHIHREKNKEADRLANEAINEAIN